MHSSHSSKSELETFVSELNVKQIRASSDYSNDAKVALMNMMSKKSSFSSDSTSTTTTNAPRFYRVRLIAGIMSRYKKDSTRPPLKSRKRSRGPRNRTSSRSRKLRVTSINASSVDDENVSNLPVAVPVIYPSSFFSGPFTKKRHERCVFARSVLKSIAATKSSIL